MPKYIVYAHTGSNPDSLTDGFAALKFSDARDNVTAAQIHRTILAKEKTASRLNVRNPGLLQLGSFNYRLVERANDATDAIRQARRNGLKWEPIPLCLQRSRGEMEAEAAAGETRIKRPARAPDTASKSADEEIADIIEEALGGLGKFFEGLANPKDPKGPGQHFVDPAAPRKRDSTQDPHP